MFIMAETYSFGVWNAKHRFGEELAPHAVEVVDRMDADIVCVPEYDHRDTSHEAYLNESEVAITDQLGYELFGRVLTDAGWNQPNPQHIAMFARGKLADDGEVFAEAHGPRNVMRFDTGALPLSIFGVHLDDISEEKRLEMVSSIAESIRASGNAGVIGGDFNAMAHGRNTLLPRALHPIGSRLPVRNYYDRNHRLQRYMGIAKRLTGMAASDVHEQLTGAGFHAPENGGQPSFHILGKWRLPLDYIVATDDVCVSNLTYHDVPVVDEELLSDHRPITVTFEL